MKEKLYTVKIISIHSYTAKDIETALQTCFGAFKEISVIDEAAEHSVQRTADSGDQLPAEEVVKNYNKAVAKSFRRR